MIELAVVGVGSWGRNLVRAFTSVEGARVTMACDADPKARERIRRLHPEIAVAETLEQVLDSRHVAAVVVATSTPNHYRVARQALLADRDVFVEKPLCLSSEEAGNLVRLAGERRRLLMVGHLLLFHPAVDRIRQMLAAGEIGRLLYIYSQRVNLGIVRTEENAWWSLAPHDVSLVLDLVGDLPREVSARGASYLTPGLEDVVFANLRFPNDVMAQIHVSWLDPEKRRKFTFVGDRKMIVFDDMEATEKVRVYDKGAGRVPDFASYGEAISIRQGDVYIPRVGSEEPLVVECRHFADCVRERRPPRSDGTAGANVVRVLDAGRRSIAAGGAPVGLEA
ncbi:MAG: Gfo/Idh/MocA family oxidoreductase [Planctomycetes bacterium]|nr:Gfo/Idh/MocA family oxidoreductase [Planctomycetota bacterium]